jgi:hypothetical protein
MKRALFFAAVVIVGCAWSTPARAQFGFGSMANKDPVEQIKTDRSKIKSRLSEYSHAQSHHTRILRPRVTNPASADEYGRMDLAGRAVAGYPVVRGDLTGHGAAHVSRGGANGIARRHHATPRRK